MEPASSSDNPPKQPSGQISHIIGVMIALLTLTLPLLTIAHFSSAGMEPLSLPPSPFSQGQR